MFEESTRSLDEIADLQSEGYYLSKKFSLVGDVVIQSTDKVRFRLHKKDLATFSGGFPPVELISETNPSEIVHLSEGAIILDLLFSFARAGRYPDIHTLEIKTLVALADAAEKYEVYSAVMACKILMRVNLERQPLQVFIYAEKYQYTDLLDETAIFVLGTPLLEMFEKISNDLFKAWLRYLSALEPLRERWVDVVTGPAVVRLKCGDSACKMARKSLVKQVTGQMPSKTAMLRVGHKLCEDCSWSEMTFSNPLNIGDYDFRSSDIEKVYKLLPKFRTFL